ncbi:MAG: tetratricopeptide repeat protein [Actinobacteria bacterium]|nr:tetratricopeptide repeat protein [Actinomycetota bacterium]
MDDAERQLLAARAIIPDDGYILATLSDVCTAQVRGTDAEACYSGAVELEPFNAETRIKLAQRLLETHRADAAADLLQQVVDSTPTMPPPERASALAFLGIARLEQGDRERACAALRQSLAFDPNQPVLRSLVERLAGSVAA